MIDERVETVRRHWKENNCLALRNPPERKQIRDEFHAALDSLASDLQAAQEALRDIERAGHVGPNALSREGMMARNALAALSSGATHE